METARGRFDPYRDALERPNAQSRQAFIKALRPPAVFDARVTIVHVNGIVRYEYPAAQPGIQPGGLSLAGHRCNKDRVHPRL